MAVTSQARSRRTRVLLVLFTPSMSACRACPGIPRSGDSTLDEGPPHRGDSGLHAGGDHLATRRMLLAAAELALVRLEVPGLEELRGRRLTGLVEGIDGLRRQRELRRLDAE